MEIPHLGEILAAASAMTWGLAIVMLKRVGDHYPPAVLNLCFVFTGMLFFGPMSLSGGEFHLLKWGGSEWFLVSFSSVMGIVLANQLLFAGLNRLGASLTAIVSCCYSPLMIAVSYFLFDERLNWLEGLGVSLILLAIVAVSLERAVDRPTLEARQRLEGIVLIILSNFCNVMTIMCIKPLLTGASFSEVTGFIFGRALVGFCLSLCLWMCLRAWRQDWRAFKNSPLKSHLWLACICGGCLSLLTWILGFKYTLASLAAPLNQLSTVFIVALGVVWLKERLNGAKVVAFVLALGGALLSSLF